MLKMFEIKFYFKFQSRIVYMSLQTYRYMNHNN